MAAGGLFGAIAVLAQQPAATPPPDERVISVVAKRFVFSPSEIVLKKGQPVRFELTTVDFGHGFKIPDLDFRADFIPDKVNVVRLVPQKTGKFDFLCDNFCGSGHEEMDGRMIVEE
jgi:cytochrome c oxidase subunit 2